ncbi:MAG: ATP-binding cassette domain-containing protein [Bacilli bacterium]|nr:ATP-binding cassette domain-containing protein [Bacilli bacterium]MDD3304604.1 ATP-binding cassette domain-containing protein [Bacilli bacterium]MDD4053752.1 ATP-binding cassette domain-containing protein [Bacilli bacterium]MDD4411655.1 ATP-binding cassette domain-containing protein [Bacilli bacterium]
MLLELKKLGKKFKISNKETFTALRDINISFEKGEFVSVVGPSGSGKSTLLNLVAGLDTPTSGELLIAGKSSKKFKKRQWDLYRKNNIGFIFQNFNLIEHLTAAENIEIVMNLIGLSIGDRKRRTKELLKKVGLEKHADHRPSELSGGQKQRVAIARALANDPDIILADEPTGSLDKKTGKQIMDLLSSIAKDKLVILVTHNNDLAEEYSSRIIRMIDGQIESDTALKEVKINKKRSSLKKKNKSMSFYESFKLSLRNMNKKKGRLAITTLAGCIGIAGFALIMGLGNGANIYIDKQLNKFANANILVVQKNVKEENEMGQKFVTVADNIRDYEEVFKREGIDSFRPYIDSSRAVSLINNEIGELSFQALGTESSLSFLNENLEGKLPINDELLVNQASAREILEMFNIDSDKLGDAIGKKVTIKIDVTTDTLEKRSFTKELTVSGIINEIDLNIKNAYYNYNSISKWLKSETLSTSNLYDYLTANTGYEIILKNLSYNKKMANIINDADNGGVGNILALANSGSTSKEGFLAFSLPTLFKTMFEQLISVAQMVITIFIVVALIVSSIMTSIVLYSSVVERKTEIGIIKAVGGRDKDVLRIFESEAMLMGTFSGILGIIVAFALQYPLEYFISTYFNIDLPGIVSIPLSTVPFTNITFPLATIISLILFSSLIAAIAGYLPSRRATKMQVVDALRDE